MEKPKRNALVVIFIVLAAAGAYNVCSTRGSVAERDLDTALGSGKPVILYFHSAGCADCIEQEAILDEIEVEQEGRVVFVRADFAGNREMFNEYAGLVASFPVVVVFNSDGAIVERYSGVTKRAELEGALFSQGKL